jgi:hypothetical protein
MDLPTSNLAQQKKLSTGVRHKLARKGREKKIAFRPRFFRAALSREPSSNSNTTPVTQAHPRKFLLKSVKWPK